MRQGLAERWLGIGGTGQLPGQREGWHIRHSTRSRRDSRMRRVCSAWLHPLARPRERSART